MIPFRSIASAVLAVAAIAATAGAQTPAGANPQQPPPPPLQAGFQDGFFIQTANGDTRLVLGRFSAATAAHVAEAVKAAKMGQATWGRRDWRERVAILRRAAALIRERKFELAAIMSLEVGKSRLESMGDA